jgi:hypothetical protein
MWPSVCWWCYHSSVCASFPVNIWLIATCGCAPIIWTAAVSKWWPVAHACSAQVDVARSPFLTAQWYFVIHCFKDLPNCPVYTFGHSDHEILYTMPDLCYLVFDPLGVAVCCEWCSGFKRQLVYARLTLILTYVCVRITQTHTLTCVTSHCTSHLF